MSKWINGMDKSRYNELSANNSVAKLSEHEVQDGWHFCNSFDGMLIHINDDEIFYCNCDKEHRGFEIPWSNERQRVVINWLYNSISEYSEDTYCAGWLCGIEWTIWQWINDVNDGYVPQNMDFGQGKRLHPAILSIYGEASRIIGGWIKWDNVLGRIVFCTFEEANSNIKRSI
jgi:hypothetical protein